MKLFLSLDEIINIEETVVALGNFDGVHKGHQELIRRTVNSAIGANLKSAVFTFNNHPKNELAGKQVVKNILYQDEKIKILKDLGVDYLISIDFNKCIQNMKPKDFTRNILVKSLRMKEVYCGFNYRFGRKGEGNAETLMKVGMAEGFGIHILEPYMVRGQIVSSTLIRNHISNGDVHQCLAFMGRYYSTRGTVIPGNRLGRTFGFPTSNITVDEEMVTPANGVYITFCNYNGIKYPSVTNVGMKPTIEKERKSKNMETHIFGFNKDIYGNEIRVEFLERIRDEIKFENVEALTNQIKEDCLTAASYHGIINR
ncbi:MAG: bifunctional riboflavin kinase/FAD synthetase [Eubacteriales bacterium]|nr:bifunctional riboflavin kinase/FAD synthetase [Eubacteriales bacterium]MDD4582688.1 bifunctional riboflavin kinase/FAD synthetase [Eubacteriales bacterium]